MFRRQLLYFSSRACGFAKEPIFGLESILTPASTHGIVGGKSSQKTRKVVLSDAIDLRPSLCSAKGQGRDAMKLVLEAVTREVNGESHLYSMSMALEPGLNVLLGPTQAGKTSLMRVMAGLDRPTTGQVLVDGQDVTGRPIQQRNVAFVYQQFINYPSLTVFENIASPLRLQKKISNDEIQRRVRETAEMMRIGHLLDRLPAALSGGQQQRTAIARALVKQAPLLLLDEPLVNLDYKLREELRAELGQIFARRNAIVVYSTTEPLEALLMGGVTAVLDKGDLLQIGPTLAVYHQPAQRRVGEVFSDPPLNILPAIFEGGLALLSGDVRFPLPPHMAGLAGGTYWLGVRAHHVAMEAHLGREIEIPAWIELAELSGSETIVHADHRDGSGGEFHLIAQLSGIHNFSYEQQARLYLDPHRLFAFTASGALAASPPRAADQRKERA
jgi:glycerol transport system ATP-binding protein